MVYIYFCIYVCIFLYTFKLFRFCSAATFFDRRLRLTIKFVSKWSYWTRHDRNLFPSPC